MNPIDVFKNEKIDRIKTYSNNEYFKKLSNEWVSESFRQKYMYNYTWMDRPIIQSPVDMIAMQELIWQVKPDLIIETGIAHGGSLIFYASMLMLIDIIEKSDEKQNSNKFERMVLGIDIDIREHNKIEIEKHPMHKKIKMINASSIDEETINQVNKISKDFKTIMVCLDSNHTHEHVKTELNAYAHLVSLHSYCIVFDTIVEDIPKDIFPDRPWGKRNNPKTAVWEFIDKNKNFIIDKDFENKLMISSAPNGYLKCIKK